MRLTLRCVCDAEVYGSAGSGYLDAGIDIEDWGVIPYPRSIASSCIRAYASLD